MKELKPILRTRFKCDFCQRVYVKAENCKYHENECYKNPNRHCNTCSDTGIYLYATLGEDLGVIPDGGEEECQKCKIAKEAGGKSYIGVE